MVASNRSLSQNSVWLTSFSRKFNTNNKLRLQQRLKKQLLFIDRDLQKKEEITDTHNKSLETWKLIYKTSLTESKEKKRQNTHTISNDFASIERIIPGWESEGKRDKQ